MSFPKNFQWGASTSAFQIEGGFDLDGRGQSIWDVFCDQPGRILNSHKADVSADHRNRMEEDVRIMSAIGINAYRFSIAWPRIQSQGKGPINRSGIDFYRRLIELLLANNITPFVTLYHWDLPQTLEEHGGWPLRDTAFRYGDYVEAVANELGDVVKHWSTINEPWCASMLGYSSGVHAPGIANARSAVRAAHHLLLAHGIGVDAIRSTVEDAEISITLNLFPIVAQNDDLPTLDCVRRVDGVMNRLWLDAIFHGHYPEDVLKDFAIISSLEHIYANDLKEISRKIDAIGVNYYRKLHVGYETDASKNPPANTWPGSSHIKLTEPNTEHTDGGWAIEPDGLAEVLLRLKNDYGSPSTYIHENGAAFNDLITGGEIRDLKRVDYIAAHVNAAELAIASGCDLRGYFVWSLLDNFEWAMGFNHRFGIVYVDFATQQRTLKESALFYKSLISQHL